MKILFVRKLVSLIFHLNLMVNHNFFPGFVYSLLILLQNSKIISRSKGVLGTPPLPSIPIFFIFLPNNRFSTQSQGLTINPHPRPNVGNLESANEDDIICALINRIFVSPSRHSSVNQIHSSNFNCSNC